MSNVKFFVLCVVGYIYDAVQLIAIACKLLHVGDYNWYTALSPSVFVITMFLIQFALSLLKEDESNDK